MVLFDGRDEAAVAQRAAAGSRSRRAGHPVSYWKQGERGWEKAA